MTFTRKLKLMVKLKYFLCPYLYFRHYSLLGLETKLYQHSMDAPMRKHYASGWRILLYFVLRNISSCPSLWKFNLTFIEAVSTWIRDLSHWLPITQHSFFQVSSHFSEFNSRNKIPTAKPFKQRYRCHELPKPFSKISDDTLNRLSNFSLVWKKTSFT